MKINQALVSALSGAVLLAIWGLVTIETAQTPASDGSFPGRVVIVELFTSEGCSSCPPADALLKKLSEEETIAGGEVIALEEHVDYWDHLGWKDPYSSSVFTERQNEYARTFGNSGVYTPQMVVDGQVELVGSRSREARKAIQSAASKPKIALQLAAAVGSANDTVSFDIRIKNFSTLLNGDEGEVWAAITERYLHTDVKAGENSGERLQHAAIVRAIRKVDTIRGSSDYATHASLKLEPSWQRSNLTLVGFIVERNSRKIIGAGTVPLAGTLAISKGL